MWRAVFAGWICMAGCGRVRFQPIPTDASVADANLADAPTMPDPRLVFHLDFEGTEPLSDKARNHPTRCVGNCPQFVASGTRGNAASFESAPGCMHVTDDPDLRSPTFTYAAWIRPLIAVNQTAFSRPYESETGKRNTFELVVDSNAEPTKTTVSTFVYHTQHMRSLTLGAWHHAAGSYDGQTMRVYYDGVFVFGSLVPALPLPLTPNEPLIGCDRDTGVDYAFFRGEIDDVRIYSAALSDAEIAALATP